MKIMLLILVFFSAASFYLFSERPCSNAQIHSNVIGAPVDYRTQVQPILQKNCTPCHFPGGKMYEKMPFDNGRTILEHEAAVSKRIKDEKEKMLIRFSSTLGS